MRSKVEGYPHYRERKIPRGEDLKPLVLHFSNATLRRDRNRGHT